MVVTEGFLFLARQNDFYAPGSILSVEIDKSSPIAKMFTATVPAASFVKKGDKFTFKGNAGGITSATLDYKKETITVTAKNVDLGAVANGPNAENVTVTLGTDSRPETVRMVRAGKSLKY